MCPIDDFTSKPEPRYLFIVFALAGDSTITSDLLFELDFAIFFIAELAQITVLVKLVPTKAGSRDLLLSMPFVANLSTNRRFQQKNLEMHKYKWPKVLSRKNNFNDFKPIRLCYYRQNRQIYFLIFKPMFHMKPV